VRYVLDASVAVRWYLADEAHSSADVVLERLVAEPGLFAVPELFFFEVLAVLSRTHPDYVSVYRETFLPATEGGMLRYPMTEGLARQAESFIAAGLTGYDAVYAALARELDGVWLTFDRQAPEAIAVHGVSCSLHAGLPSDW